MKSEHSIWNLGEISGTDGDSKRDETVLVCSVFWTRTRFTGHSRWNETELTTLHQIVSLVFKKVFLFFSFSNFISSKINKKNIF